MNQIETIGDALPQQIDRCIDLLFVYEKIGPTGKPAQAMIRQDIRMALKAIADQDTVAMIRCYNTLMTAK